MGKGYPIAFHRFRGSQRVAVTCARCGGYVLDDLVDDVKMCTCAPERRRRPGRTLAPAWAGGRPAPAGWSRGGSVALSTRGSSDELLRASAGDPPPAGVSGRAELVDLVVELDGSEAPQRDPRRPGTPRERGGGPGDRCSGLGGPGAVSGEPECTHGPATTTRCPEMGVPSGLPSADRVYRG